MREYFDDYNKRTSVHIEQMLAKTYVEHNVAAPVPYQYGNADEIKFWQPDPRANFTVEVLAMVAEGNMVATRVRSTGTFRNDTVTGYPKAGRPAQYESNAFWRFECGKVAEGWIVTDILTRDRQEGVISDAELSNADPPTVATPALKP